MPRFCSSSRKSKARASPAKSGLNKPASLKRESDRVVFKVFEVPLQKIPWSICPTKPIFLILDVFFIKFKISEISFRGAIIKEKNGKNHKNLCLEVKTKEYL